MSFETEPPIAGSDESGLLSSASVPIASLAETSGGSINSSVLEMFEMIPASMMPNLSNISAAQWSSVHRLLMGNRSDDKPAEEKFEEETHQLAAPILFLFLSFMFGAFVRFSMKRLQINLPYTVVLFVCGAFVGLASHAYPEVFQLYTKPASIDPKILLHVFLPILIFESAFAMDAHVFIKCFSQCLIMAVPGLIICASLTAFMSMNLFHAYNAWSWHYAFLFGAILSATDPVAVVALLRDIGTSKVLTTIIDGEALLNDGSAIVIYEVLLAMLIPGNEMNAGGVVLMFCRISIGGPVLGYVMGKVTIFLLAKVFNDSVIEITITISSAYIAYYLAEITFHVSGVLAVVALGTVLSANKVAISPEVEEFVHSFWEMMSYLANTLIFIIVGVLITEQALRYIEQNDLFLILVTYIAVTVFRFFMIGVLSPFLCRLGYGLQWQDAVVMTWGGLRGAVGLALALSVARNPYIEHPEVGHKILIHVSGIVMLTLLVNATTTNMLLRVLGMNALSSWKRANMRNAVNLITDVQYRAVDVTKDDVFLGDADWTYVKNYIEICDPYEEKEIQESSEKSFKMAKKRRSQSIMLRQADLPQQHLCADCADKHLCFPSLQDHEDLLNEARLRLINVQKVNYWHQFEKGLLLRESVLTLVRAADVVADKPGAFLTVSDLRSNWEIHGVHRWLQTHFVNKIQAWNESMRNSSESKPLSRRYHRVVADPYFRFFTSLVVLVDMICSVIEFILRLHREPENLTVRILRFTNVAFVAFYAAEAILKMLTYGFKPFFSTRWNRMDFLLLIVSVMAACLEMVIELLGTFRNSPYALLIRFSRLLRLLNLNRLLRILLPIGNKIARWVNDKINERITAGYDIGRGFELGQLEVSRVVDRIVHYKPIAERLQQICNESRLDMVRELAYLQDRYPDIAVAVKTRRAARHILNTSRSELNDLKKGGLLDDTVYQTLHRKIQMKMMHLRCAPSRMDPRPAVQTLKNLSWIAGNEETFRFFRENVTLRHLMAGTTLCRQGDISDGLYLIIVGVAKEEGQVQLDRINGGLPVIDSYHWFSSDATHSANPSQLKDILTTGSCIGEISYLTKRPRDTNVICETDVKVYHIKGQVLDAAFLFQSGVQGKFVRSVALRISREILSMEAKCEDWTTNKIMLHLDEAIVHDLSSQKIFNVLPGTEDVILVQGCASDGSGNGDTYCGPCYVPKTVTSLKFDMIAAHLPILVTVGGTETEEGTPGTGNPHLHGGPHGLFFSSGWAEKVRHLSVSSQFGKGHYRGGELGEIVRKRSFSEHSTSTRHLVAARSKTLGAPASLPLSAAELELCERAESVAELPKHNMVQRTVQRHGWHVNNRGW
ncbi:sodium/hydrogen exchanger 10-like isoform X2 [Varroa jacobsoni]|uniref:Cyclic nucleotide-binding domain-containing protein n=1 Tax=Varroa destructor TaxID=109461 RepID=A0A7M7MI69_VARDE|nr:sodium/hydrogen exchanger 10-like isoform X4 [Varroa destructor]XP_022695729.1 sodium/hydrogen exchanger 10-like isoform X2 [Varroa jacobsoni]